MNNKEVVNKIGNIFEQAYYFSNVFNEDCDIDSLVRIEDEFYDCDKCVLLDTINIVRMMCPLTMKRETRILK